MKTHTQAKIVRNQEIAPGIWDLRLQLPEIAQAAQPGQFVMLYPDRGDLLLPRPISIADASEDTLRLVYQVVGKGTAHMSGLPAGASVRLLGPLGNGFDAQSAQKVALIGGGIGVPPLYFLLRSLAPGVKAHAFLGFRQHPIMVAEFEKLAASVQVDIGGRVLDLLDADYDLIFACGPKPMLRAVAEFAAQHGIPAQVCMEERMACGIGTCVGCVTQTQTGYQKVCCNGPVFDSEEVVWA